MPRRRSAYHHGDLSNALLAASEKLVEKHGMTGFSLREAARAVGVDPAACYRHFASREALLDELAKRAFAELGAIMQRLLEKPGSDREHLRAMGHAYVDFACAQSAKFRVMFGPRGVDVRNPIPGQPGSYRLLEEVLGRLNMAPAISVGDQAVMFWSIVHGLSCLCIDRAIQLDAADRERLVSCAVDSLMAGLEQAKATKRSG